MTFYTFSVFPCNTMPPSVYCILRGLFCTCACLFTVHSTSIYSHIIVYFYGNELMDNPLRHESFFHRNSKDSCSDSARKSFPLSLPCTFPVWRGENNLLSIKRINKLSYFLVSFDVNIETIIFHLFFQSILTKSDWKSLTQSKKFFWET